MIKLEIEPKTLYQLLVSEERYGCSRNNHLMPMGAFDNIKEVLPQFYKLDNITGIATAKQICEEIINELNYRFFDGLDDEFNNREDYLDMILWLLDFVVNNIGEWKPYNWDTYLRQLSLDCEKRYYIEDMDTKEQLSKGKVSKKELIDVIMKDILNADMATYTKNTILCKGKEVRFELHIQEPIIRNIMVYVEGYKKVKGD